MHSIRGRLVLWYAVAMGATMFVFALLIYLVQRSASYEEVDARARLEAETGRDPDIARAALVPDRPDVEEDGDPAKRVLD